jgi:phenylalanyl-tRNA synthetase beta chain
MKVSINWLSEFIDLPTRDPEELGSVFASLGHELEGVERLPLTFDGVIVGRVETIVPHPNADKVRLCTVTTTGGPEEIICGAWNFEVGAVVAVAVPGATLDSGAFKITQRDIRGVTSNGMICSARELGLGDNHEGIMVLDDETPVGADFSDFVDLPDAILDLTITPNRGDAMSMLGLARELAAYYQLELQLPDISIQPSGETFDMEITVEDPDDCNRFLARRVTGVAMGESPLWMQQRLVAAGVRSISNVVDVSNYVMMELGQPNHTFDYDKIRGGVIGVRRAVEGETLTTLDEVERALVPGDLLVTDGEGPSSLAGTMGGASSEVSATTTSVLVEAAAWNPPLIMRMSRRLTLRSEASARFERGVDVNLPPFAADRVAHLLAAHCGGVVSPGVIDIVAKPVTPWDIDLPISLVKRVLGLGLVSGEVRSLLERLHMTVSGGDILTVTVPTFRRDLTRPIDLIEEVARLYGFDNFPDTLPSGPGGGLTKEQVRKRRLREILTAVGLSEASTFSFHGAEALAKLGLADTDRRQSAISVRNPLREEESLLRTTLLPGLLESVGFNVRHGLTDVALFEIGKVFFDEDSPEFGVIPNQPDQLAFVLVGSEGGEGMYESSREVDVFSGTAMVRALLDRMGLGEATFKSVSEMPLHPGRGASVHLGDAFIGVVGELHPSVAQAWALNGRVVVGEFELNPLLEDPGLWQFVEPSIYPQVDFDLAFELDVKVSSGSVVAALRSAAGGVLETVDVFDEFVGGNLEAGRKSLAIHLRLRDPGRTLAQEDVTPIREACIAAVELLGGLLRGP